MTRPPMYFYWNGFLMTATALSPARRMALIGALALAVGGGLTACGEADKTGPDVNVKNSAVSQPDRPARPMKASKPQRLEIPSADVNAGPFLPLVMDENDELGVPPVDKADQPGWWTKSPTPGETGASVIVAHYDTKNGMALMKNLKKVKVGDRIKIKREDGSTATFKIREVEQVRKDKFPTSKVYDPPAGPELRLLTCGGDIVDGHRSANIIYYADLVA